LGIATLSSVARTYELDFLVFCWLFRSFYCYSKAFTARLCSKFSQTQNSSLCQGRY